MHSADDVSFDLFNLAGNIYNIPIWSNNTTYFKEYVQRTINQGL